MPSFAATFGKNAAMICGCLLLNFLPARAQYNGSGPVPVTSLIVRCSADAAAALKRNLPASMAVTGHSPVGGLIRVTLPRGMSAADTLAMLALTAPGVSVTDAEPDRPVRGDGDVHGDPFTIAHDGNVTNPLQYWNRYADLQAGFDPRNSLWTRVFGVGSVVAVIDTGADYSHIKLYGRLMPGYNALNPGASPDDAAETNSDNSIQGHGTMIASQILNVAPGATVMPMKALHSNGAGSAFDVADCIYRAIANGAEIINLSLGTDTSSNTLSQAVAYAINSGAIVVAAAGNSSTNVPHYPAAYPGVISVGAIDMQNRIASFSNYGSWVAIYAPGVGVRSAFPGEPDPGQGGLDTEVAYGTGTSFSTPYVTAQCALIWSANPLLHSTDVINLIYQNALPVGSSANGWSGVSMINIYLAVIHALP